MDQSHIAITHERAHADDLLALWEIHKAGRPDRFTGIEHGLRIRYIGSDAEIHHVGKTTHVGLGGGEYDEHGKGLPESSASLVGADLGLLKRWSPDRMFSVPHPSGGKQIFAVEDPKLRDLFAALVRDDISGSPPFSFGNLVDTVYYYYPNGLRRVRNWAWKLFDAAASVGPIPAEEREMAHREAACLLLSVTERIMRQKRRRYHERAGQRLIEWLTKRLAMSDPEPLNLIDAVAVMKRAGNDFHKWMLLPLRAEIACQHHFHAISACEAAGARFRKINLLVLNGGIERVEEREVALVKSDDPFVHQYLFWEGSGHDPAVIVKQDSRGNMQISPGDYKREALPPMAHRLKNGGWSIPGILDVIFRSNTADEARKQLAEYGLTARQINGLLGSQLYGLVGLESEGRRPQKSSSHSLSFLMPAIAGLIRALERRKRGLDPASWSDLISVHGPPDERTWFFYYTSPKTFKPGWLLNGSLTREVPATALSLEEIGDAVVWALDVYNTSKLERIIMYLQATGAARIRAWMPKTPSISLQ